jgi:hypothetical protein
MEKVCPCGDPPGGEITCNVNQLALCGIIDGKLVVGCFDQPVSVMQMQSVKAKSNALANWILTRVTGIARNDSQEISGDDFDILTSGRYVHPKTGEEVKFSAPEDLDFHLVESGIPIVRYR